MGHDTVMGQDTAKGQDTQLRELVVEILNKSSRGSEERRRCCRYWRLLDKGLRRISRGVVPLYTVTVKMSAVFREFTPGRWVPYGGCLSFGLCTALLYM